MKHLDIEALICALRTVVGNGPDPISLHEPMFIGNEWAYAKRCLDTGWVSSVGEYVNRFEADLAHYTGVKRAVAVVNGTAALHICLKLAGVEPHDEVILPSLTFVATANAVMYSNAIPHFADVEERTLGLDPFKLEKYLNDIAEIRDDCCYNRVTGRRLRAVLPMHTFGHPVDLDRLEAVCDRFRLVLIEDAAESLGTFYKGKHTGNWGLLSALSFNGNKIITTGGGGAVLSNDENLAELAKHLTTTAKIPHPWEYCHDHIGFNYRMPNINAAIGCAQLEQLPDFIKRKRSLANRYKASLEKIEGIRFFTEPEYAESNYWLNTILLDAEYSKDLEKLLVLTNRAGIMTRPAWRLMHRLPMFADCPRMNLSVSEDLEQRIVNIPSSVFLEREDA